MNKNLLYKTIGNKIAIFIVLFCLTSLPIVSYAIEGRSVLEVMQQQKITIDLKNVSIDKILEEIKKQSGLSFMFKSDVDLKLLSNLSLTVTNKSVEEALKQLFTNTNFTYDISGKVITIVKRAVETKENRKITVSGTVVDSNKTPIAGATVIVQGTPTGAITDNKGGFTFMADKTSQIEVSFMGMETVLLPLETAKIPLVITMKEDAMAVEDVVVTGYFDKTKNTFTGAANKVTEKEIRQFGTNSIVDVLQFMVPGLKKIDNNSEGSNPNNLPEFMLRGKGSFLGDTSVPIFILDGYQVSIDRVYDMDIERIASVTVLKDASATIYYGSRASNGVIVIETKRPKEGALSVSYNVKLTASLPDMSDYNLMNAREKLEYELRSKMYESNDPNASIELEKNYYNKYGEVERGVDIDWLEVPTKNTLSHKHSLYIEGGDKVRYAIDASIDRNIGVMRNSGRNRESIGYYLTYRVSDKISIRNYLSYASTKAYNSPYGQFSTYASLNPYDTPYKADGQCKDRLSFDMINPLYNAELTHKDEEREMYITDNLSVDISILKNLKFKGLFSLEKNDKNVEKFLSPNRSEYIDKPNEEKGSYEILDGEGLNWDINMTLNYSLNIKKHNFFIGLGANFKDNENSHEKYSASGFPDDRLTNINFAMQFAKETKPYGYYAKSRLSGYLGNINYSYDNRYFVDLSGRIDGSSKFGKDSRFAKFYSGGLGWNIHNEPFMKNVKFMNILKLRGSMGYTGNQEFDPWLAVQSYDYASDDYYYNWIGVWLGPYGNTNLQWQRTLTTNIGADLSFFDNRLSAEFNYYIKSTDGLLLPVTVPPSLGFTQYTENYGKIENRGVEIDLRGQVIRKKDWGLIMAIKGSHNKNKVVEISDVLKGLNDELHNDSKNDNTSPVLFYKEGESISAIKAVPSLGINPENGKEVFLNRFGQRTYDWDYRDKVNLGDEEPDWFGNLSANLMYKNWTLNVLLSYQYGGQTYNETLARKVEGAYPSRNADKRVLEERWSQPGQHVFYKDIADKSVTKLTSRFVQDNNFLQLSNVSLQYDFSKRIVQKMKLEQLRVGFYMSDLFRAATVKQERGTSYPFARSFSFSVQVTL